MVENLYVATASSDPRTLRQRNLRATLGVLRGVEHATLAQLAQATALSRQTIEAILAELIDDGWVEELPPDTRGKGRPARRVRFRAECGVIVGLDIGAHKVVALVADLNGTVIASKHLEVTADLPGPDRLETAHDVARRCLAAAQRTPGDVRAAAVGTIGVVDLAGRVHSSQVLPGWTGLDLAGHVGRWFACPGFAENDANCSALAEHWLGVARPYLDAVHILVGWRTSASLVIGGSLHRGRHGAAGEIGALPAITWLGAARELADLSDAHLAFEAARAGEPQAVRAVNRFASRLATGVAALALAVDPEILVIGGGFSRAGDVLLDPLRAHVAEMCIEPPVIVASGLGDESVALGAVRRALDHVEQVLLP